MIKAVIFDMDGVLLDTERMMSECYFDLLTKMGLPNAKEIVQENLGIAGCEIQRRMGERFGSEKAGKKFYNKFCKTYVKRLILEGFPVKEGVKETLSYLKEKGYTLAVASTTDTVLVKITLTLSGLRKYFDSVTGGTDVKNRKPAPDVYLKSMEKIGKTKDECYAVEDSNVGVKAAISSGIKTIIIPDLIMPNEENTNRAFRIFNNMDELLQFFKKENEEPN